jgi:hypothetical protein
MKRKFSVYLLLLGALFLWGLNETSHAVLTNILVGGDFESPVVTSPGVADGQFFTDPVFDTSGQWNSNGGNNYELWSQGFLSSPTLGSDGLATGQHLELRGQVSNGQIVINVDVPMDVHPISTAYVRFDSWFRTAGTNARIRIRKRLNNTDPWTNVFNNVQFSGNNATWTANSYDFNVAAGERVQIRIRNGPRNGNVQQGLHLDDVQVLVNIVPEPGLLGAILVGVFMMYLTWKKKFNAV